ncbi:MAG: aldo/keto reductase [Actinomycetota bacterium]|jgi:aryl-alcohol dehydrogenase-like predicted oxidoreductase|nr:aldo/keto reductase [Actinomycetota bacterium]MDQ3904709.1 aldo/keto reductase [Actinomycetota bacterium]
MRYRLLGTSGLRVAELFLGAMTFGEHNGAAVDECARMLDAYADAGGNVIDTAVNYAHGASEELLGQLLVGRRDRFVLATKYTITRDGTDPNAAGSHRKNLRHSLETSLRRLRTDYVDLLWVHIWDPHTPIEETLQALDDQVRAGNILYIGISNAPAWVVSRAQTLAELRGWSSFVGLQVPYSLLARDIERELLPMAAAFGLSVAAWGPLAGGVLSGKFTSGAPPAGPTRVTAESIGDRERAVATLVTEIATELGISPAQVAIAWIMTRSPALHPIIGARRLDQLVDNLGALAAELPAALRDRLDQATAINVGYPTAFIADTASWVYGEAGRQVIGRTHSIP